MKSAPSHHAVVFATPWPGIHGTRRDGARRFGRHWHSTHGIGVVRGQNFLPPFSRGTEADNGAVTLIQRFGSAASLNIHLHCLVLDGVYGRGEDGVPEFVEVPTPTDQALQAVLHKIITRTLKLQTQSVGSA